MQRETRCDACGRTLGSVNTLWCRNWHAVCQQCLEGCVHRVLTNEMERPICPVDHCKKELPSEELTMQIPDCIKPIWRCFISPGGMALNIRRCPACQALMFDNGQDILFCPFRVCLMRHCRQCPSYSECSELDHKDTCPHHAGVIPSELRAAERVSKPEASGQLSLLTPRSRMTDPHNLNQVLGSPTLQQQSFKSVSHRGRKVKQSAQVSEEATHGSLGEAKFKGEGTDKSFNSKSFQASARYTPEQPATNINNPSSCQKDMCVSCRNKAEGKLSCSSHHTLCRPCANEILRRIALDPLFKPRCPEETYQQVIQKADFKQFNIYKRTQVQIKSKNLQEDEKRNRKYSENMSLEATSRSSMSDHGGTQGGEEMQPVGTRISLACPADLSNGSSSLDEMGYPQFIRNLKENKRDHQEPTAHQVDQQELITARCEVCGTTSVIRPSHITFECHSPACGLISCRHCRIICSTLNDPSHVSCSLLSLLGDECLSNDPKLPANWDEYMDTAYQQANGCLLVKVALESLEGVRLIRFYGLTSTSIVTKIWRVQNPYLWVKYTLFKQQMLTRRGCYREKPLFFALESNLQKGACRLGFKFPSDSTFRSFGRDTSFYSQAHIAEHLSRHSNQVMIAFVLCGISGQGREGERCQWKDISGNPRDTLADNLSQPKMYVAFSGNQCYPAYLVSFE